MSNLGTITDGLGHEGGSGSPIDARIGSVIDKFTIVRLLGKGGMGAVYEARHAKLSRRFAIKFLLPELAANREILRRFENEAKAAGGLEHANLAAVTDVGTAPDGAPYLVMEFLHGEDCSKILQRLGPLPVPRATNIVMQACRGLAIAHREGIVHRDLKPENLFLTDAGDGRDLVKVLDFGIAKLRSAEGSLATGTGTTFGTAHYMSPEQARGASEVDQRTDVWSLGVVLYELLSDHKPFEGEQFLHVIHEILSAKPEPIGKFRPGLPSSLVSVIQRAMEKDVARRIGTVMELAEALAPFTGGQSFGPPPAETSAQFTLATPATGMWRSAVGRAQGADAARGSVRRSLVKLGLGVGLIVGLVTATLVLRPRQRASTTTGSSSEAASASALPTSPSVAPTTPPVLPLPSPTVVEHLNSPVRTLFEQFGHDSTKATTPIPFQRKTRKPAATPNADVSKTSAPLRRTSDVGPQNRTNGGIAIDPGNPY